MPPRTKRQKQTTVANNNKKRKCRSKAAIYKRNEREFNRWQSELVVLQSHCNRIKPHNGKIYSPEENSLLIRAIVATLERRLKEKSTISWTCIEQEIANVFHVRLSHITWLQQQITYEGTIVEKKHQNVDVMLDQQIINLQR